MWICLIGAPTCKQRLAMDIRDRGDFKFIEVNLPPLINTHPESAQINLLDQYFRITLDCQKRMNSENIVTIGSFWSQHLVYGNALLKSNDIDQKQFEISEYFYNRLAPLLEPPSFFIHCNASHMDVMDRVSLKNEEEREGWVELIRDGYKAHAELIRVPVVDVDAGTSYDKIWNGVEFDLAQMKTTRSTDQTLWRRTMFMSGYL